MLRFAAIVLALWAASPDGARAQTPAVPHVVADIAPVHGLVARVMQGAGAPLLLLPPGTDPHHYALRPSEAGALSRADLVVWVGAAMTPWLADPLEVLAGQAVQLALFDAPGTRHLAFREGVLFAPGGESDLAGQAEEQAQNDGHDHGDGHEHDHENTHGHGHDAAQGHGHDHDGDDPHAWLDPENGKAWLDAIAGALAALDPDNAALYAANAAAGRAEIDAALAEIAAALAPVQGRDILALHDAFQYFETRFGLQVVTALSQGDAARPGPARIAAIRDALSDRDIACVLAEPQAPLGLLGAVLESDGTPIALADPLGRDIVPGPDFYPALLRGIAAAMTVCAPPAR